MPDRWERSHRCIDHAGRPRDFEIVVEGGKVMFHTPPGEVAGFHPELIGDIRDDLQQAQVEAIRQRGGRF